MCNGQRASGPSASRFAVIPWYPTYGRSIRTPTSAQPMKMGNNNLYSLVGKAKVIQNGNWEGKLYKEVPKKAPAEVNVRLVPYYSWGNRGHSEMTVWIPVR